MHESDLAKKMAKLIRDRGGWARKIAGGPGQAGLPDILAGYRGHGIGLEVKMPGREGTLTDLQAKTLRDMASSGMVTAVVTTVQQVGRILDKIDGAYDKR